MGGQRHDEQKNNGLVKGGGNKGSQNHGADGGGGHRNGRRSGRGGLDDCDVVRNTGRRALPADIGCRTAGAERSVRKW